MAIAYNTGAAVASPTNSGTAVSITLPAGLKGQDVALLRIAWNNGGTGVTCTAPTGWTAIDSASAGSASHSTYYKVAAGTVGTTSSDASTAVTATLSSGKAWAAEVSAFTGCNVSTPIHAHAIRTETASSTSHATPSVTVSSGGCWLATSIAERASTTAFTVPTGLTSRGATTNVGTVTSPITLDTASTSTSVATGTQTAGTWTGGAAATLNAATTTVALLPSGTTNVAPTAIAGTDQTGVEPYATVTLAGSGTDPDGTIASYAWTQLSGPAVTLSSTTVAGPTFTAPASLTGDTLTFGLIVTDNSGAASAQDSVAINTLPATEFVLAADGTWQPLHITVL
jgi:hypothetical protein